MSSAVNPFYKPSAATFTLCLCVDEVISVSLTDRFDFSIAQCGVGVLSVEESAQDAEGLTTQGTTIPVLSGHKAMLAGPHFY